MLLLPFIRTCGRRGEAEKEKGPVDLFPAEPTEGCACASRDMNPRVQRTRSAQKNPPRISRGIFSCGRRDLNPHDREATRTLILLVYQFQHFREQAIIYQR